jgi:peptidoglycan hydrolase CwlO-like protein
MKKSLLTIGFLVLVLGLTVLVVARAQATQTSYTLNLNHFTVQLTYPSQVNPGDSVTVNTQAIAKDTVSTASLTTEIFYADRNNLRQLTSATVISNGAVNAGTSLSKQITFIVPQDAPRTSLTALVTETVQRTYASYYYYSDYGNNSGSYCYYPDYYYYCIYGYYPYGYGSYIYPSYSYTTATDSGVVPLSYIKAQTPEYTALQSQYQGVEQQLSQTQAQNRQLQQQLQSSQSSITQRNAAISILNQQLGLNQNMNITLEAVAACLGLLAILFGAFALHYKRASKRQPLSPQIQDTSKK